MLANCPLPSGPFKLFAAIPDHLWQVTAVGRTIAAVSGSKLNRAYLKSSTRLMSLIVPTMIQIMISAGVTANWGAVCFPPLKA